MRVQESPASRTAMLASASIIRGSRFASPSVSATWNRTIGSGSSARGKTRGQQASIVGDPALGQPDRLLADPRFRVLQAEVS